MDKQKYTVISTSGWQGSGWIYRRQFDSRKVALWFANKIKSSDGKSNYYLTAVIGDVRVAEDGYNFVGDCSRTGMRNSHLDSRNCFIADNRNDLTDEPFDATEYIEEHLTDHDVKKWYEGKTTRNAEWLIEQFGVFGIWGGGDGAPLTVSMI